ncbi:hypothetical protein OG349_11800 [Streptomyces sp. NBC_01317]|uniref:hypothetical protein n=1 Tax=Streptomyces sp. NBC_01317 TaxID=2903822 RepID=UPI002E146037|nr:hypothetical protein OG349_11800 [Streptomyces sp. NBC_01317]
MDTFLAFTALTALFVLLALPALLWLLKDLSIDRQLRRAHHEEPDPPARAPHPRRSGGGARPGRTTATAA